MVGFCGPLSVSYCNARKRCVLICLRNVTQNVSHLYLCIWTFDSSDHQVFKQCGVLNQDALVMDFVLQMEMPL